MLKGCDISKWQGVVDFEALKNVVDFVIIRSSYGNGYTDAQFTRNRNEIRRIGKGLGYYHYSYPQYNTPEAEANWFLQVVGTPNEGEILCLDFEESYADPVPWCQRFLDTISGRLGGYKPLLYANRALINAHDWKPINSTYGLWLAYWDYNPGSTGWGVTWSTLPIRQWSNREAFPGITGGVDADIFYGDKDAFLKCGYHSGITLPPTIEKLPKDEVLRNMYTFLCGSFSDDEIAWRLSQNKNIIDIGNDICSGDARFYDKWIKPKIPAIPVEPVITPEPSSHEPCAEAGILTKIHDILYGTGWWWVKYFNIKQVLPK